MFSWITSRTRRRRNAQNFYGSIVALSRAPALYSDYGVPDTVEGRFEILVLHMFAALERFGLEKGAQRKINQDLVNLFFADMDTTSRELGVGDMKVPKQMRMLAAVFEERIAAYNKAFKEPDMQMLSDEFEQNIFIGNDASHEGAKELVCYAQTLRTKLADISIDVFMSDEFDPMRDLWTKRQDQ
jgi:cytochrome b pre-mRNA-processing protein 3